MERTDSREKILQKIRQALSKPVPVPFADTGIQPADLFPSAPADLDIAFAENFTSLQGQFAYCQNMHELAANLRLLGQQRQWTKWYCADNAVRKYLSDAGFVTTWHEDLASCQVSITTAEALVARTGSLLLSSAKSGGRTTSVYAPVHICVGFTYQLVWDISDALSLLQRKYGQQLPSLVSLATGPSRTADIEKTLVTGVHGPKEVFCFLIEQ
jgi:L-lactate dehydrogenase complex protein LldG